MVLLRNLVSFLWLIRGRVVWVALPMFAPIKQGSLLGYAMFTTMHRDEMKSYGPLCKTSSKKVAKFAQAMFSTKNRPKRSWLRYGSYQSLLPISEQLWYLPMWACKDRKEPTIASYVQNRKHKKSPFITTGHVCLASCWWWLAKKMSKRFERKLGFA